MCVSCEAQTVEMQHKPNYVSCRSGPLRPAIRLAQTRSGIMRPQAYPRMRPHPVRGTPVLLDSTFTSRIMRGIIDWSK